MEALTYRVEGDYQVPNLTVPKEGLVALGKYALLRKKHLRKHRRVLFTDLLTSGRLNQHLMETEQAANERMELLTQQLAKVQEVDERMKAQDQMKWVGLMNNIRNQAEGMILQDLVYA